jgi:hypothetical protein
MMSERLMRERAKAARRRWERKRARLVGRHGVDGLQEMALGMERRRAEREERARRERLPCIACWRVAVARGSGYCEACEGLSAEERRVVEHETWARMGAMRVKLAEAVGGV